MGKSLVSCFLTHGVDHGRHVHETTKLLYIYAVVYSRPMSMLHESD